MRRLLDWKNLTEDEMFQKGAYPFLTKLSEKELRAIDFKVWQEVMHIINKDEAQEMYKRLFEEYAQSSDLEELVHEYEHAVLECLYGYCRPFVGISRGHEKSPFF
ncbi:MAG: hypothetical protein J6U64_03070 [Alphaproteobacteria bacterium]|nr:hypothetical protein [Alphaproteobacteria bacterium]